MKMPDIKNSRNFFAQIFSDSDGKKIIASYLKVIVITTNIILPVYLFIKIFESRRMYPADFIIIGFILLLSFLLFLIKKGNIIMASILFLISAWIALTSMALFADGVKDIAIVGYVIIIFLATLFTGIRFAVVITAMSIISVWVMGIIYVKFGMQIKGDEPLNYSRDYTVLFLLVLTSIILFARSYRYSFTRINKELQERIRTEEKLSKSELILREKNVELEQSNMQMRKMNEDLIVAMEKAEESGRLKTAFLQNISHEIRTPMNGIVGFVNLLEQSGSEEDKKKEYIEIIKSCSVQLVSLVNDIIEISRIESGTLELNISEFRLLDLLSEIKETFNDPVRKKGLTMSVINKAGDIAIRSDQGKIFQVLKNLADNAIKFTVEGTITISVTKDDFNLNVTVADTGIGVKRSIQKVIFDRFRQAEDGLTRSYGGSGLGLAISKGNVDFLGGKIWFTSEQNKGSIFSFSVPVKFISEPEGMIKNLPGGALAHKIKIMVVEDDEINSLYIIELLKSENCEVILANNGLEAIEIFRTDSDIDIVLMDLRLPGLNGYDTTQKIKAINPDIPVIAVTAFSPNENVRKAAGISFDGYIIKPVEKSTLIEKISQLIK
jgi:signal transduction histidine kinase